MKVKSMDKRAAVLVTGAGGGIGAELVRAFATDGDRVIAVDKDAAALERFEQGDTDRAEAMLSSIVNRRPDLSAARLRLAEILWSKNDPAAEKHVLAEIPVGCDRRIEAMTVREELGRCRHHVAEGLVEPSGRERSEQRVGQGSAKKERHSQGREAPADAWRFMSRGANRLLPRSRAPRREPGRADDPHRQTHRKGEGA